MSEANPQPMPHAESPSPLSSITSSPVVASMKSGWSALPQKTNLFIALAAVAFFIFAAVIGVSIRAVTSGIFGGGIEAQVSSRGEFVEQQFLRSIGDLKVTKEGRDELRLRFTLSSVNGNICGPCRFTVAMADRNGEIIHYFNTQPVFQIWQDWRDVDPRKVDLTYRVKPGLLRRRSTSKSASTIPDRGRR